MSAVATLLPLWEAGNQASAIERPLQLLAALGEGEPDALAQISLGERDRRILALRQRLFGHSMACTASCPRCAAVNEFELDMPTLGAIGAAINPVQPVELEWQGETLALRRLTTADLLAVAGNAVAGNGAGSIGAALAARVLHPRAPDDALTAAAAAALEAADPLASIQLDLACAECGESFDSGFDPTAALWAELKAAAHRLLDDVHVLARAYGWSENAILALSPARRQVYLDKALA